MQCYRFTAKPSKLRQSYMAFDRMGAEKCIDFWPNEDKDNDTD